MGKKKPEHHQHQHHYPNQTELSRLDRWRGLFALLRFKQWIKNLFVFAPIIFSLNLFRIELWGPTLLAFLSISLVAGSVYVLNDIVDIDRDRIHPKKRNRPLPSGQVKIKSAMVLGVVTLLAGFAVGSLVNVYVVIMVGSYLLINLFYTFIGKNIMILDAMLIAAGFVLRVLIGAVAISVPASSWLLVSTFFLALLLGFAKRYNEMEVLKESSASHREVLLEYSEPLLRQFLAITSAATIMAYTLYTMDNQVVRAFHSSKLVYTLPFVMYGVLRYLTLVFTRHIGGEPSEVVMKDGPMRICILLWILAVLVIIYPQLVLAR
ncbi:MAG: decaprenyl-phosphate phosphoribosyltransferase [Solirubrobacterales bacterium]